MSSPSLVGLLLVGVLPVMSVGGCAPEPHRGPFDAAQTAIHHESLHLSSEMSKELFRYDPSARLVQLRLELRDALLRTGDRIEVLADDTSNEVLHCSLLVVGHDPERLWATVRARGDEAHRLAALPSPVHARLYDPHGDPDGWCHVPEGVDDDRIEPEVVRRRRAR